MYLRIDHIICYYKQLNLRLHDQRICLQTLGRSWQTSQFLLRSMWDCKKLMQQILGSPTLQTLAWFSSLLFCNANMRSLNLTDLEFAPWHLSYWKQVGFSKASDSQQVEILVIKCYQNASLEWKMIWLQLYIEYTISDHTHFLTYRVIFRIHNSD